MIPLVQGLLALALPLFAIWKHGRGNGIRHPQLFVAGIEDTIDAAIIIAVVLTAVTVIADVIALSLTGERDD